MTIYHANDFDFAEYASSDEVLALISRQEERPRKCIEDIGPKANERTCWELFFAYQRNGQAYHDRRYLAIEFEQWLSDVNCKSGSLLEVGCGCGASILPLLSSYPQIKFIGTDFSEIALEVFKQRENFDPKRITLRAWDATIPNEVMIENVCCILCIFTMSAVCQEMHLTLLKNCADLLEPGGTILFRDYGVFDLTMFRHQTRCGDRYYRRKDGTAACYFTTDCIKELAESVGGLIIEQLAYVTVALQNRKNQHIMKRVFVHAVLRKM